MEIHKLRVSPEKFDINLQFYFFLKHIVKLKPTDNQIAKVTETIQLLENSEIPIISSEIENIFKGNSKKSFSAKYETIQGITTRFIKLEDVKLFSFSLALYQMKDLLLKEAKITNSNDIEKLSKIDPLSLEYDTISVMKPYATRVNGALLSLLFFEKINNNDLSFISQNAYDFMQSLVKQAKLFRTMGLEANQVFMLMFSETINQSIISDSGSNYETRILSVLSKSGITNITKEHDRADKSMEFDFFFQIESKSYGISAKRTLRERYKQFIKSAHTSTIDVMIEITLGLDLNEEKAKNIIQHDTFIFVSDEVYQTRDFLQKMDKVYSVKELNLETLKTL